jgi:uncharacterized membrane protein YeaQ/YmgE (transglycosylase-associated protein family)
MLTLHSLLYTLVVGAVAGWISGLMTKGKGFGIVGNIIVGIIGALLGNFLFGLLGFAAMNLLSHLISAIVGALIFLYLLRFIKK